MQERSWVLDSPGILHSGWSRSSEVWEHRQYYFALCCPVVSVLLCSQVRWPPPSFECGYQDLGFGVAFWRQGTDLVPGLAQLYSFFISHSVRGRWIATKVEVVT